MGCTIAATARPACPESLRGAENLLQRVQRTCRDWISPIHPVTCLHHPRLSVSNLPFMAYRDNLHNLIHSGGTSQGPFSINQVEYGLWYSLFAFSEVQEQFCRGYFLSEAHKQRNRVLPCHRCYYLADYRNRWSNLPQSFGWGPILRELRSVNKKLGWCFCGVYIYI